MSPGRLPSARRPSPSTRRTSSASNPIPALNANRRPLTRPREIRRSFPCAMRSAARAGSRGRPERARQHARAAAGNEPDRDVGAEAVDHLVVGAVAREDVDRLRAVRPLGGELRRLPARLREHGLGPGGQRCLDGGELLLVDSAGERIHDQDPRHARHPLSSTAAPARARGRSPSRARSRSARRPARRRRRSRRARPTARLRRRPRARRGRGRGRPSGRRGRSGRASSRQLMPRSVATTSVRPPAPRSSSSSSGNGPASSLSACIRTSTRSRTERRTGGRQATSPTRSWSSSRTVLPLARLRAKAHLAERVTPPVVEAVPPAVVLPVPVGAAPGRERRGGRELGERTGRPPAHDEVHDERVVVVLHQGSVREGDAVLAAAGSPRRADRPGRGGTSPPPSCTRCPSPR